MTKLEKEFRRREQRRINSINKVHEDLAEDALRALWSVVLVLIGIVLGFYMAETRSQAAETVSIAPRCEYVGAIPTEPQNASQPPTGANELPLASMPDAEKVEAIGTRWERLGRWKTTGYCKGACCNGRNAGRTASGAPMTPGRTVAVGGLPFGTVLRINGVDYVVEDRGTPYGHIDILYPDHKTASNHGVKYAEVFIKRGK